MPIPQEICVFFPCHTLEDFPTHLRDESAAGILAAWTAPWHPAIIAATGVIPTWHRADTPPVELRGRLLLIPSASDARLPSDLDGRMNDAIDCQRISVDNRPQTTKEILQFLLSGVDPASDHNDLFDPNGDLLELNNATPAPDNTPSAAASSAASGSAASICAADFYALGYLALQVQVMTRRLRYSSNLDLVTFSEHIVAAAKAYCSALKRHSLAKENGPAVNASPDLSPAIEPLQAAFDLLAEERDHYFSSDPHLIDLVLVAQSTLGPALRETLDGDHPVNLLISAATAEGIAKDYPEIAERIRQRHAAETLSIVGGSPDDDSRLDYLGSAAVAGWIEDAVDRTHAALGIRPIVFGRLGGGIPGDLPPWLVGSGFRGAITNDFISGTGWQDEPKMLWQAGGAEIEALTAKPLEVLQPQTFLGIGPKMGETADSGQVAAALLVRWPGTDSPFLEDLRRSSKFSLALGHFWTLDRFFTHGERPYHSCTLSSVPADGVGLSTAVENNQTDPLSSVADRFCKQLKSDAADCCDSLAQLLSPHASNPQAGLSQADSPALSNTALSGSHHNGEPSPEPSPAATDESETRLQHSAARLASALGFAPVNVAPVNFPIADADKSSRKKTAAPAIAMLNPHCGAARGYGQLEGPPPPANTPGLFGSSKHKSMARITIDVPGNGFAAAQSSTSAASKSTSKKGLLGLFSKPKPLAHGNSLSNEFLDVAVHPESGAIAAVHAGQQRGNRFSWQLAYFDASGPDGGYSKMHCRSLKLLQGDTAEGMIETIGDLMVGKTVVAQFVNRYTLLRGSRWLEIDTQITSLTPELSDQPWKNYVAGRSTWAADALSIRPLVRDKRHRTSGRRIESPLGVIVDEGDRKLQVCSYGLPAHRRIGTKELDTLLIVRGETQRRFQLAYGFDVPSPVRSARQHLVPPIGVPIDKLSTASARGWLLDIDARTTIISQMRAVDSETLEIVAVETSGKPTRARISLFRDVVSASRKCPSEKTASEDLPVEDGAAVLRLSGHEVARVRLKLA